MALQDITPFFTWGAAGSRLTPDQIAQRQKLAQGLLGSATDTSPIAGGWASILAKALAGGMAGYDMSRADAATMKNADDSRSIIARLLSGSGPSASSAMSASPSSSIPMSGASSEIASTNPSPVDISGDKQTFVNSILPAAIEEGKRTGIDPRIIVAQAAQETGWGQSAPGNNYFGIKSHGLPGGNSLMTTEYVDGQPVQQRDSFRGYASPADSVRGYGDFILQNPRYTDFRNAQGLDAQLSALGASGYATDPNYASSVGRIARGIQLPGEVASNDPQSAMAAVTPSAPVQPVNPAQTQIAQAAPASSSGSAFNPAIVEALSNPYISDQARSVAGMLLNQNFAQQQMAAKAQLAQRQALFEQTLKQSDPAYQADLRFKNAQTDQIINPRISPTDQANLDLNNRKFAYEQEKDKTISPKDQADLDLNRQKFALDQQNSQLTNDVRDFNFAKQNGYTGTFADYQLELKRAGAARTNVDTGTIPQGYQAVRDANGNLLRYDPVPGGPADMSKKDAAAADSKQTFTDVITNAADLARNAYNSATIPTTGLIGRTVGEYLPSSNAAEVRRQVGALKSNATIENLNAMRQQSPTGGALGNVTEGEGKMLAAKAGTLDPDSPNFLRDLDDYERTLLRIVHGKDAGDKIYDNVRGNNGEGGRDAAPAGVSPDIWSVMTPEEKALWQKN